MARKYPPDQIREIVLRAMEVYRDHLLEHGASPPVDNNIMEAAWGLREREEFKFRAGLTEGIRNQLLENQLELVFSEKK